MNDHQLRIFLAVAEKGGFSQAEGALYITKQAIRKQMDELEKEVGVPLLLRTARGVQLTAAGQTFYAGARALLEQREGLLFRCRQAAQQCAPPLRLAVPAHPRLLLEQPLALFARRHPEIQVRLTQAAQGNLQLRLQKGELDLAECAGSLYRDRMDSRLIRYTPLARVPYVCLMAQGHPLAGHRSLTAKELAGYTITVDRLARRPELVRYLQRQGVLAEELPGDEAAPLLEQLVNVCYAQGIYCTPAYFAVEMHELAAIPLDLPPKDIGLICLHRPSAQAEAFLDCALECREAIQTELDRLIPTAEKTLQEP